VLELQKRINNAIFNFEIIKPDLENNLLHLVELLSKTNLSNFQSLPSSIHINETDTSMYYIDFYFWSDSYKYQ